MDVVFDTETVVPRTLGFQRLGRPEAKGVATTTATGPPGRARAASEGI